MTAATAGLLAVLLLLGGVALLVVGGMQGARSRRVVRVRVPARALSRTWTPAGDVLDVEYPGPDGRPLRATITVALVQAPGQPYTFDGTVWVSPDDPTDVTPRQWGRQTRPLVLMILGGVLLVGALGMGVTCGVLALDAALPTT